jgi:DNA-binding NtrC family response regulator
MKAKETLGRILIADKDKSILSTTAELLHREGYQCTLVRSGTEAINKLEVSEFDLLITEIHMPGNEGLELVKAVPRYADGMPVILFTGYPTLQSAIASIQLPVTTYLVRPVRFSVLLHEVKMSIANYHALKDTQASLERARSCLDEQDQINRLTSAIEEAIQVLQSAQNSCESEELASLRRKLEQLLASGKPDEAF